MNEQKWTQDATKRFVGKTIVNVRWMTDDEAERTDWNHRPLILLLDDGEYIYPMQDDEGNNGGALADSIDSMPTWPVLYPGFDKGNLPEGHPNK